MARLKRVSVGLCGCKNRGSVIICASEVCGDVTLSAVLTITSAFRGCV